MTHRLAPLFMMGAVLAGSQAMADDAPTARPNKTSRELMKQCKAEQKAKNPDASAADIRKICKEQVKSYAEEHPSVTTPSKTPAP